MRPRQMYHLCIYMDSQGGKLRSEVQKWGNSLAIRIPKVFARELGIDKDREVDISLVDGRLLVSPAERNPYTLEGLLAEVTQDNLHAEVSTGPVVGDEAW